MLHGIAPLEMLGVAVFAISGAVVAARKGMDPLGFAVLASVTAIGGGTLRDLLLARSVFWIADPSAVIVCIAVALAVFVAGRGRPTLVAGLGANRLLLWADAAGLALFAVTGTLIASEAGAPFLSAVLLGTVTASFGGVLRDVLGGEVPMLLRSRDLYATAAALGAVTTLLAQGLELPLLIVAAAGFAVAFSLRAMSILAGWSLPGYAAPPPAL
jgi:uncharacterized membrane protein YeiH